MKQSEKKPRTLGDDLHVIRNLMLASVAFVVVIGGLFAWNSLAADAHLQRTVDDIVAARTEGRLTTCQSDQRFELAHNRLVTANEVFVTTILRDSAATKPPDERPAILAYAAARTGEFEVTKVPVRDCSPAGIEAFYTASVATAATPCPHGANNRGFCAGPTTTTAKP
jgi:hypothetical protein